MLVFDIETNGLLDTMDKIHCIVIKDRVTGEIDRYDSQSKSIDEGVARLGAASSISGHHIEGFDIPAIQIVYPDWKPQGKIVDTLPWARCATPDISKSDWGRFNKGTFPRSLIGSHSLKAYGIRMGCFKDDFGETTDWQEWSPEMSDYCERDVVVNDLLIDRLIEKAVPENVLNTELRAHSIFLKQKANGFMFDIKAAQSLHGTLAERKEEVDAKAIAMIEPWYAPAKWGKGEMSEVFVPKVNNARLGYTKGVPICKIKLTEFNPNSNDHIGYQLQKKYGWKPKEYTKEGQPVVSEEVLKTLKYPIIPMLLESQMLKKRLGQLAVGKQALMKNYNEETGRIHGSMNTCGAVTSRMTHMYPNIGQVPSIHNANGVVPFGKDFRELFTVPKNKVLVGIDASGLELRTLAGYMAAFDGGEYIKIVLEGDVHTFNQEMGGMDTRDQAKRFIYAFLYGAGVRTLAGILGVSMQRAKEIQEAFFAALPGLKKLIGKVQQKARVQGWIRGLDGRTIPCRSQHSALNTLLQSAGAIIMKEAYVLLYDSCCAKFGEHGYRWAYCANVHDEWQMEVDPDIANEVGKLGVRAIIDAGKLFNFKCPLDGEFGIGRTWAETH